VSDDTSPLEDIEARLEAHSKRLESLEEELDGVREERDALRNEVEDLEEENEELREEIEELDARTDLLRLVENNDEMDAEQYAAALVQHLKQAAERARDRGREGKASVDREEAEAALKYPDVKRTTIYKYMRDAVDLVGDEELLWYESNGYGQTRLKINLEKGEIGENEGRG